MLATRMLCLALAFLMRSASAFVVSGAFQVQARTLTTLAANMFLDEANSLLDYAHARMERLEHELHHDSFSTVDVERGASLTAQNIHNGGITIDESEDTVTVTFR